MGNITTESSRKYCRHIKTKQNRIKKTWIEWTELSEPELSDHDDSAGISTTGFLVFSKYLSVDKYNSTTNLNILHA